MLLKEEMRRVIAYLEHRAGWWVERGEYEGRLVTPALAEGLKAYAEDQAQLQRDLAAKFHEKWAVLRRDDITDAELEAMAPPVKKRKHDEEEEEEGAEREEEEGGADVGSEDEREEEEEEIEDDYNAAAIDDDAVDD